jgi:hypothetical protein
VNWTTVLAFVLLNNKQIMRSAHCCNDAGECGCRSPAP